MSGVIHRVSQISTLRQKAWPWYHAEIGNKLTDEGRKLLEDCGVRPEDVEGHIHRVRDEAWDIFPFACIGEFWFIEFGITHVPQFRDIVSLLGKGDAAVGPPVAGGATARAAGGGAAAAAAGKESAGTVIDRILAHPGPRRLLDLGTCVGQDLRALRAAGAPAESLYGSDVFAAFEHTGHRLFLDESTFAGRFFVSDVFDDSASSPLALTAGHWDVVTMIMFLHQYDRPAQKAITARALRLLRHEPGAMLVGYQTGQTHAAEQPLPPPFSSPEEQVMVFRQSEASMREMMEEVLTELESGLRGEDWKETWSVWVAYDEHDRKAIRLREITEAGEATFYPGDHQRRVQFCVRRI